MAINKKSFSYIAVAVIFLFVGMVFSPSGNTIRKMRKKLGYTRAIAQKLYSQWEKDELVFYNTCESLQEFEKNNSSYILYFWATWCPHCMNVADIIARLENAKLPIIAMTFDTDKDVYTKKKSEISHFYRDLVRNNGDSWNFVIRANQYNIPSIPSAWIVENGRITRIFIGEKGIAKMHDWLVKQGDL